MPRSPIQTSEQIAEEELISNIAKILHDNFGEVSDEVMDKAIEELLILIK